MALPNAQFAFEFIQELAVSVGDLNPLIYDQDFQYKYLSADSEFALRMVGD
ncbi:hypothetical protein [Nostoc sp.]|uniref:hypothetical protein n=1 Tax=Nostoc sp. TaxID=1180 RepID=UPI002FF833E2